MNRPEPRGGLSILTMIVAICAGLALGSVGAWFLLKGSMLIVPIFGHRLWSEPPRRGRRRSRRVSEIPFALAIDKSRGVSLLKNAAGRRARQ
jgi:hypothetical protein